MGSWGPLSLIYPAQPHSYVVPMFATSAQLVSPAPLVVPPPTATPQAPQSAPAPPSKTPAKERIEPRTVSEARSAAAAIRWNKEREKRKAAESSEEKKKEAIAKRQDLAESIIHAREKENMSYTEIQRRFGLGSRTFIHKVLTGKWSPELIRGRPTYLNKATLHDLELEVTSRGQAGSPMTPKEFQERANVLKTSQEAKRGNKEWTPGKTSGGSRFMKRFRAETGVNLKAKFPRPQDRAKLAASTFGNLYNGFMSMKQTMKEFHEPSDPKGMIPSHLVLFMDEFNIGPDGLCGISKRLCSTDRVFRPAQRGKHLTGAVTFNGLGQIVSIFFISAASPNVIPNEGEVILEPGVMLCFNSSGTMQKSEGELEGTTAAWAKTVVSGANARRVASTDGKARRALIWLDGSGSHADAVALSYLDEHGFSVGQLKPNMTHLMQVSDNERLHGMVQVLKRDLYSDFPTIAANPQLHLHVLAATVRAVFTPQNIWAAMKDCAFEFSPDHRFVGISDESARRCCESRRDKGQLFDPTAGSLNVSRSEFLAVRESVRQAVLPRDFGSTVPDNVARTVAVFQASRTALEDGRIRKLKRTTYRAAKGDGKAREGTLILDPATLRQEQERRREKQEETARKKEERESKRKERAIKKEQETKTRDERSKALRDKFPEVTEAQWSSWERGLNRFYTGRNPKWNQLWAEQCVRKKLRQAATNDAGDVSDQENVAPAPAKKRRKSGHADTTLGESSR
jgi:hypothetical protein